MDLLVYLATARERVVSADELLREVWQGRVFDDGVVYKKSISSVRRLATTRKAPASSKQFRNADTG